MRGHEPGALPIAVGITGRPRGKTINVSVVHTERGGNEHGVVNLDVGRPFLTRPLNVF